MTARHAAGLAAAFLAGAAAGIAWIVCGIAGQTDDLDGRARG